MLFRSPLTLYHQPYRFTPGRGIPLPDTCDTPLFLTLSHATPPFFCRVSHERNGAPISRRSVVSCPVIFSDFITYQLSYYLSHVLIEFIVNVLFDAVLVRIERYGKFAEKQLLRTFHETLVNLPEALVVSEGILCLLIN